MEETANVLRGPWAESLLRRLSRPVTSTDPLNGQPRHTLDSAMAHLVKQYPTITQMVRDQDVLDFGCGSGHHVAALARAGARFVWGVDLNSRLLDGARVLAAESGTADRTAFGERIPLEKSGAFDVVMSHNSMEHFPDPEGALREMFRAVRPGGQVLIGFGPPWFAPYGSHMHYFTTIPWVNLIFSESTIMRVREQYRSDGATRYEQVEGGLNRMSVKKFERLTRASGLQLVSLRLIGVKGLDSLTKVPGIRELLTNEVVGHFRRPPETAGRAS